MALDTDLSRSPYFDDYTQNSNHYAVLYRPGVPVQAREMNEVQSTLQDQIDKFGRSIYKEGSVIEGCSFTFDNQYSYVKLNDAFANGTAFTITDFIGNVVTNSNGLTATIVDAIQGYQSSGTGDLNTLYLKYLNSGSYANGAGQSKYDPADTLVIATSANVTIGNVVVANSATANVGVVSGYAYNMAVTEGVIFKKGYFIRVPAQSVVVSKYTNLPDGLSVGFGVIETIETPASNSSLYDNAAGTPNYNAPGAHRLKLTPNLVVKNTADIANTATFFSVCDFQMGRPVTIKNDPQYSALGTQLAKRTFETNGDFVVNPFILSVTQKVANDALANTYLNLVSSPGLAYAKGYRVEFLNSYGVNLRKGIDTESFMNQFVSTNFGYYVYGNEFVGDFNTENIAQVELHNVAKTAVSSGTFLGTSYSSSTKIGTAFIRGIEYGSGTPGVDAQYLMYLFDIQMSAGFNFSQVKSIIYAPSSTLAAVTDVVLTYDYGSNTNIAQLQEIVNNTMVFPFGQKAVAANSFNNTSFTYRNRANSSFQANGSLSIALTAAAGTGTETFTYSSGTLGIEKATFTVIPIQNGYSANNTGTVSINTTSSNVVGSGTTFTTNYNAGDVVVINGNVKKITNIYTDTLMAVNGAFANTTGSANHQEFYPAGLPVPFVNRSRRSIVINSSNSATLNLGSSTNGAFTASIYFDVKRSSTVPIKKTINRNTLVKINTATNPGGITGPWCLGLTDVLNINHVWVNTGTYSNTVTDSLASFALDNGQRDTHYDLAYLKTNLTSLPASSLILVSVDHFTHDQTQGVGFFTANSYPVDDVNTSNTAAITTAQIPLFFSPVKGTTFDLRDSVDFRPFGSNTATITTSMASATVNPANTLVFSGASDSSVPGALGAYLPTPNETFQTDLAHYLPRRDRVALTTAGQLLVTEGISDTNPRAPTELPGTMSIGIIDVPPYPTLPPNLAKTYNRYDYATNIGLSQTKRYTMADIGTLDNRIKNLEYYTSLSLLETSTSNLLVRSGTTGQNRFKNGILVDPFKGHDIGNTLHPQYSIAVDANRQEARPFFRQFNQDLYLDQTLSTGYRQRGHVITIDHSDTLFQQQPYASKYRNCIEGNVYNWRGSILLYPSGDTQPDKTVSPDVVNNLDLASNWVNLQAQQAWGTNWGNWVTTSSSTAYGSPTQTGASSTSYNSDGSSTTAYQTQINTTTTSNQVRTGSQLNLTTSNTELNLGTFVTDISIQPYIKPQPVFFSASGLKPSTRVYAYFNDTHVDSFIIPLTPYTGSVTTINNVNYSSNNVVLYNNAIQGTNNDIVNNYYIPSSIGSTITTDSFGRVSGLFIIPQGTFKTGDVVFKLVDISDLTQGQDAISTQATATFVGSGLSVSYGRSILNTRQAQLSTTEVTQQQTIQQNAVVAGPPIIVNYPAPPPPPQPDYNYDLFYSYEYTSCDDGGASSGGGDGGE